ncbi:glutathione S-transferase family protein [Coleofasciculus sp. FACHB-T130]|nr:glutathione S-transferase family protein [Coleofasciculus sp. FACHB-T130]MBD1896420.1 glutathione S-transferase family protein [Coleofasciculus sp. FACHB-129]MBD2087272.1 glutathione S-transferase family protein [Coleofasciculus sp. FACHB-542]
MTIQLSIGCKIGNASPTHKAVRFSHAGDRSYFGSPNLTLAEVVAGSVIPWLPRGGVSLSDYPKLSAWCDRLIARETWQATEATPELMEAFKSRMAERMAQ